MCVVHALRAQHKRGQVEDSYGIPAGDYKPWISRIRRMMAEALARSSPMRPCVLNSNDGGDGTAAAVCA